MSDEGRRSSPPPPPPDPMATQTGSYPAVPRVPETTEQRALRIALQARTDIGREPTRRDPGSGLWRDIAEIREMVSAILARLDAADAASAKWTSRAARVLWRAVETLIPLGIAWLLLWLSGHWR